MVGAVRVRGLRELSRDFRRMSGGISDELVDGLKAAAEDVRTDAENYALTRIRNMPRSPHWAGMRIGVSKAQGLVFMVPSARGRGGRGRANLATLLMERSMDPALQQNASSVERNVSGVLDKLAGRNGF